MMMEPVRVTNPKTGAVDDRKLCNGCAIKERDRLLMEAHR